jgi:hypothetical protein
MLVAIMLARHAHEDGTESRPGLARLASETRLNERSVRRALAGLLARQVIRLEQKAAQHASAHYAFPSFRVDIVSTLDDQSGHSVTPDRTLGHFPGPTPLNEKTKKKTHDAFTPFWSQYPRTNGTRKVAADAWAKLSPDDQRAALAGLPKWLGSDHWHDGYIV